MIRAQAVSTHACLVSSANSSSELAGAKVSGMVWRPFAPGTGEQQLYLALADKQKTSDFTSQHEERTGSQKTAYKAAGHKGEDVDQRVAPAQDQGEGDSNVPQGGTGKKPKKDHIPGVDIGSGQSPD